MAGVTRRVRCWIVYAAIGGVVVVLDVALAENLIRAGEGRYAGFAGPRVLGSGLWRECWVLGAAGT